MKSGLALIVSVVLLAAFMLKYTGFCFAEGGYLSKRRIIEAALAFEFRNGDADVSDPAAYLEAHPECCRLDRNPHWVEHPFMNALFGQSFFGVHVVYPLAPDRMREPGYPYYETEVIIECCAAIVTDSYGTTVATPRWPGLPPKPAPRRKRSAARSAGA